MCSFVISANDGGGLVNTPVKTAHGLEGQRVTLELITFNTHNFISIKRRTLRLDLLPILLESGLLNVDAP